MVESLNYEYPKDVVEYIGTEMRRGNDFIVFELGDDLVAKRPNFERSSPRVRHEISSPEYYENLVNDQSRLKEIFQDNFEASTLYPASDTRNFVVVQKRFRPEQFLDEELNSENAPKFIAQHREEFKKIVFAAKKVIIEFGYPADLHPGNLVLDNGKILFMEADCPTYRANKFYSSGGFKEKVKKDLERLAFWEEQLHLTPAETDEMYKKFDIDQSELAQKVHAVQEQLSQNKPAKRLP